MNIGSKRLISMSDEINGAPHFQYRNGTIEAFEKMIRRQFDTLYREGRAFRPGHSDLPLIPT